MSYTAQLYAPLEQITRKMADIQWSLVSVDRAFELLDESPDVPEKAGAHTLDRARGEVLVQGVSFAYGGDRNNSVLQDADLQVQAGERIGIVGRTGAGKSTLVSLLLRFYDPLSGSVKLDGLDVRDYQLEDLRKQFAMVLQEPVLFSSSIAENIAYSKPNASMQEIIAAAQAAHADEFIRAFPQGYDTQVGERGMSLSGGERQRISLARAFLKDAPLLIMDEPTSSVDVQTEAKSWKPCSASCRGAPVS
ncbi:MAG: ABC transporter ATP-binding protein [Phycisphaerales bacterium]|nr:ABC transporter ATP-binding protein [Phycisphaerales bacterium]